MKVSSLELIHVGRHALGSDAQWTKVFSLVLWNILVAALRVRSNSFEMCKRSWPWRHTTFSAGADGSPHWVSTVASAASSVDAALPVETSFCSSPSTAATSGVTVAIVRRELSEAARQRPKSLWDTEKLRQHRKSTNTKKHIPHTHAFPAHGYYLLGNTCAFPTVCLLFPRKHMRVSCLWWKHIPISNPACKQWKHIPHTYAFPGEMLRFWL